MSGFGSSPARAPALGGPGGAGPGGDALRERHRLLLRLDSAGGSGGTVRAAAAALAEAEAALAAQMAAAAGRVSLVEACRAAQARVGGMRTRGDARGGFVGF